MLISKKVFLVKLVMLKVSCDGDKPLAIMYSAR